MASSSSKSNNNDEEDDFFSSFGDSLMKDLLNDISTPSPPFTTKTNNTNAVDLNNNNKNLTPAKNLTSPQPPGMSMFMSSNMNMNNNSIPPGLPPGLTKPSAGALVVDHAASIPITTVTPTNHNSSQDAWSQALSQFSTQLTNVNDFLQADSARKEQKHQKKTEQQIVDALFDDDECEYDVNDDIAPNDATGAARMSMGLFPGLFSTQTAQPPPSSSSSPSSKLPMDVTNGGTTTPDKQKEEQKLSKNDQATPPKLNNVSLSPHHVLQHPPMPHHMMPPPPPHVMTGPPHPPPLHMMQGHPHPPPPPPHVMVQGHPHFHHPPPHMMGHPPYVHGMMSPSSPPPLHPGQFPHPTPPPHGMMPMNISQYNAMIIQQQQHQQQQMKAMQPQSQPQEHENQKSKETLTSTPSSKKKKEEKQIVNKIDFPALGANQDEINQERKEEEEKMKKQKEEEEKEMNRKKLIEEANIAAAKKAAVTEVPNHQSSKAIRITFQDTSANAPPVPATSIPSTSMTSRDLCHVLHSIMRPMLTFDNVLDAYNADYYHWSYNDRKSRNLLFSIGGAAAATGSNLPNPVWKETKMKAKAMESKFRDTVEKRADEWSKEKQALGKIAKANVKRPRALLATTALVSSTSAVESRVSNSGNGNESDDGEMTDEYKQRAFMWAARVGIDKGYLAYLDLVELRRLLQSRPGDALNNVHEVENRRDELLHDVEENVNKLHIAFGVDKNEDTGVITVDAKVLARTMSLPKGRVLLSRVVDEGILPHPSACHLLAPAIRIILESSAYGDLTAAPPAGEDRLLRSLTGLVQTVRPSVDAANFIACLTSTIDAKAVMNEKKKNLTAVLTGKRTLMQLLHSIFTRGGEVCVGENESVWKQKESLILMMLSENE